MARIFTLGKLVTRCQQRIALENSGLIGSTDTSEWKALVSAAVGELYSIVIDAGANYFTRSRTITSAAASNATGSLVCVTKANIVDGETFQIDDGYGNLIFEFDTDGSVESDHIQVDISGDTTADDVGSTVETAINAAAHDDARAFAVTASNTSGTVTLTHDETGEIGNQLCHEDVANAGFSVSDMTGGGYTYRIPADHLATLGVYYVQGSGQWVPLYEYNAHEYHEDMGIGSASWATRYAIEGHYIRLMPYPPSGQTYKFRYAPNPPDLANRTDSYKIDVITPDGEEFIVAHVGVNALSKEDSQVGGQLAARKRHRERVELWATKRALNEARRHTVDDAAYGDRARYPGDYIRGGWPW